MYPHLEILRKRVRLEINALRQVIEWPRQVAACSMGHMPKENTDKVNCKLCQSGLPRWETLTCVQPVADRNKKDRKVSA